MNSTTVVTRTKILDSQKQAKLSKMGYRNRADK